MAFRSRSTVAEPGKPKVRIGALKTLWPFVMRQRGLFIAWLIALAASSLATLSLPLAVRRMIDHGFTGGDQIDTAFALLLVVAVALALATAARFFFVSLLGERVVADLRNRFYGHLLDLDQAFFEQNRSGDLVSRLSADTELLRSVVGTTMSVALRSVVMVLGSLTMLVVTSPRLAAYTLVGIPLFVLPLVLGGRKLEKVSRQSQDRIADANALANETLGAIRTVQAHAREPYERGRFGDAVRTSVATGSLAEAAVAASRPAANPAPAARPVAQRPPQPPALAAAPAAARPQPESVPPWEVAGGSDVPPWEELPPDLPVIGPYDTDPGYNDYGFSEPAARAAAPRHGAARQASAPAREAEPARAAVPTTPASAESARLVAPRPPAAGEDGTPPVFTGEWPVLAAGLPLKGLAQQLAYQSELTQVVGRTFHLRIPVAALGENGVAERLQQALCDHFGEPVRVVCEVGGVTVTAAAADAEARAERQRQAEAAIEADPFVQGLLREFGGQIVPGSVQPRAA